MMDKFCEDLRNCRAYIDDLLIFAETEEELYQHLQAALAKAKHWISSSSKARPRLAQKSPTWDTKSLLTASNLWQRTSTPY
jgi:hypothetical protein